MIKKIIILLALMLIISVASATYYLPSTELAANASLSAASGTGGLDFSSASGMFNTSTGANYINGVVTAADNISMTQGKRLVLDTAGSQFIEHNESGNYFGIWGNPLAVDGLRWTGNLVPTSGSDMVATGGDSDLDYSASTGHFNTSTGTNYVNGDVIVASGKNITSPEIQVTSTFTMDAGSTGTLSGVGFRGFSTDDNWSLDSSFAGYNTFLLGNSSENQTIELDGAANTTLKPLMFVVVRDPGTFNVTIEGEGLETIAGNARLNTTENYATLTLISDGTEYYILSSNQTWTT